MTLPDLLERLLTDRRFRAAFRAGRAALPEAFATIDPAQLESTAERLREDLSARQFRGSGGLQQLFPETIAAFQGAPEELFARFLESDAYRAYREWPRSSAGTCLEEAFYRFAEASALGDPAVREREGLGAMVRAVLLSPDPGFALAPELTRRARGIFALARRGAAPFLFAATPAGFVQGTLTPFLADLLTAPDPAAAAARHGVSDQVLAQARARLAALGLS